MDYHQLTIHCSGSQYPEIIEAELLDLGFESFEQENTVLKAYVKSEDFDLKSIESVLDAFGDVIEKQDITEHRHQNWNAVWESNYPSVKLDNELFIGAPVHSQPADTKHSIVIDPNMSFGTGHHPTTEQVLRYMFNLDLQDKSVLDFGCGSGVLSIYAGMRNASGIGIEIDPHAAETAKTNLANNQITSFEIKTGDSAQLGTEKFDIILANINRNVIEENLPHFINKINAGGTIICSGFLVSDTEALCQLLIDSGLKVDLTTSLEEWGMIAAKSLI
ncbi:MAG: 50S ribosomal protein L11 methyltransferase [Salibacteraceae bacterium]